MSLYFGNKHPFDIKQAFKTAIFFFTKGQYFSLQLFHSGLHPTEIIPIEVSSFSQI
ncbi:MAG: hypothetical protein QM654_11395 [Dysgonamonadaceae bacterium]